MAEIVNLRLARKARERAGKAVQAAENRAKFGETKGQKTARSLDAERVEGALDGARRETD